VTKYTIRLHDEADGTFWAEVEDLPGCLASGETLSELKEALGEAISLYLSEPGHEVTVDIADWELMAVAQNDDDSDSHQLVDT